MNNLQQGKKRMNKEKTNGLREQIYEPGVSAIAVLMTSRECGGDTVFIESIREEVDFKAPMNRQLYSLHLKSYEIRSRLRKKRGRELLRFAVREGEESIQQIREAVKNYICRLYECCDIVLTDVERNEICDFYDSRPLNAWIDSEDEELIADIRYVNRLDDKIVPILAKRIARTVLFEYVLHVYHKTQEKK